MIITIVANNITIVVLSSLVTITGVIAAIMMIIVVITVMAINDHNSDCGNNHDNCDKNDFNIN